jgi:hypothetical protein
MSNTEVITLIISGYAALLSTGVFIWSVYWALTDKGDIKIGGFFGHLVGGIGPSKEILYFDFVNSGKRSITITTFGGKLKRKYVEDGKKAFIVNTPGLPLKLEPGDRHQVTFDDFGSVDERVKDFIAYDSVGRGYKMKRAILRRLVEEKKSMTSKFKSKSIK